jgi:hypothetical protein
VTITRERRRFRWSFKELLPSWLRDAQGEAIWYSIGSIIDGALDRAYRSLLVRMPTFAPPDAYPYFEQDRKIRRGISETAAGYSMRLIGWLDAARVRGNAFALLRQVRAYMGGNGIRVRTVDVSGNWYTIDRDGTESYLLAQDNWTWDGVPSPPNWGRFFIIIYPRLTNGSFEPWGLPPPLDGELSFDGSWAWGSDANPEDVETLRKIIEDEKPAGTRAEWIIYYFFDDDGVDPDAFDPAAPDPDGTWHQWGAGEPYDLNRTIEAAYIKAGQTVTPFGKMEPS